MVNRKIQLIAGSTYTVSLPKDWVVKNKLKEGNEVLLSEQYDRTIIISPTTSQRKIASEIVIPIDDFLVNLDQILFSVYYLGIESIILMSKQKIAKETKLVIRKTVNNMSGTEISFEESKKVVISVLLDKLKIDVFQVFYRMSLLLDSSLTNILEGIDRKELKINEDEIDRLYHLATKVISLSLIDTSVLHSSHIKHVTLVPGYLLISKRLENLGDTCNHLSKHLLKLSSLPNISFALLFAQEEIKRAMKHLVNKRDRYFEKIERSELKKIKVKVNSLRDETIKGYLHELVRYVGDLHDEVVNISFYTTLIKEEKL